MMMVRQRLQTSKKEHYTFIRLYWIYDINLADGKLALNLFLYDWKNCRKWILGNCYWNFLDSNYTSSITTINDATMNIIPNNSNLTDPYSIVKDPENAKMCPNNPNTLAMVIYANTSLSGTNLVAIYLNKGSNNSINVLTK